MDTFLSLSRKEKKNVIIERRWNTMYLHTRGVNDQTIKRLHAQERVPYID